MSNSALACPECAVRYPPDQIDTHLRRAHRIYRFRGLRRSLPETLNTLVNLLASPADVAEAWATLEAIAREEYGRQADAFLASTAGQALAQANTDAVIDSAARAIAAGALASRIVPHLAAQPEAGPRRLALGIIGHLPIPVETRVVSAACAILPDKRLPMDAVLTAAVVLIPTTGKEGPAAARVFRALIAGWGKSRGIERLGWLEQRSGPSTTLDAIRSHLHDQKRLSCPRCGVEQRRQEMTEHLWEQHRLILDGQRVREPWSVIEECIQSLPAETEERTAALLARCRAVAEKAYPDGGLGRLHRLLLTRGLADEQTRQAVLAEAAARGESLCPHCFARVPAPVTTPPRALNVYHGRVSGLGYRVEVADRTLFTGLQMETPLGLIRQGFEPGRRLTSLGAMLFCLAPPIFLAGLVSLGLLAPTVPPLLPVVLLLIGASVTAWFVRVTWRQPIPPGDRAVDYAWKLLVPQLHEDRFSLTDSAFAAALAWTSLKHGQPSVRAAELARLLTVTEQAVAAGSGAVEHLADLRRLAIEDAVTGGQDPVLLVAAEVARSLDGKLPLGYAERLLTGWESSWWTKVMLTRLRVLLCERAFEAGFEVTNLEQVGQAAPTLGAVLATEDPDGLARLRLLWSQRTQSPLPRDSQRQTAAMVRALEMVPCPECGQPVRPRVGEMGSALVLPEEEENR